MVSPHMLLIAPINLLVQAPEGSGDKTPSSKLETVRSRGGRGGGGEEVVDEKRLFIL